MKKRHLIIINAIFIMLIIFSAGVVYQFMTGRKPLAAIAGMFEKKEHTATISTDKCSDKPALTTIGNAKDPQLRKLHYYQVACHSFVTDTVMFFVDMPTSEALAKNSATKTGATLKEFAKAGIRPLVIAEPSDPSGNLDFGEFATGKFDTYIDAYFKALKAQGLTSEQMGIWTPFPEANLPYWNNNKPEYFGPSVTRYLTTLRKYFPKASTSVLLNSATYEVDDFDWRSGDYASLLPYIKGIPKGLVDYAGLQGFPWMAPKGDDTSILNGAEFANSGLLAELADGLKTKKVWFNTGAFASKYTLDPEKKVELSPERRKDVLLTIKEEAITLKKKGYTVAINLFAEDKSQTAEATDWSFWQHNQPFNSTATPVVTEFIASLPAEGIAFWLFDK